MYNKPKTEQSRLLPMQHILGVSGGDIRITDTPADPSKEVF